MHTIQRIKLHNCGERFFKIPSDCLRDFQNTKFLEKYQDDNHSILVVSPNQEWTFFPGLGSHHMDSGYKPKKTECC